MLGDSPRVGSKQVDIHKSIALHRVSQQCIVGCPHTQIVDQQTVHSPLRDTRYRKSLKRARLEDIDGEAEDLNPRKKRRLRLDLVTSRLSKPYSTPSTNIVGTTSWRFAGWARQRFAGGKLLRKAAILNWTSIKGRKDPLHAAKMRESLKGRTTFGNRSVEQWSAAPTDRTEHLSSSSMCQAPQRELRTTGTFQMPSDYDDLDYEDDIEEEGDERDEKSEKDDSEDISEDDSQAIHSDFRQLENTDTDSEFYDTSWSFANVDGHSPKFDSPGLEIKLVLENERRDEVITSPSFLNSKLARGEKHHGRPRASGRFLMFEH